MAKNITRIEAGNLMIALEEEANTVRRLIDLQFQPKVEKRETEVPSTVSSDSIVDTREEIKPATNTAKVEELLKWLDRITQQKTRIEVAMRRHDSTMEFTI